MSINTKTLEIDKFAKERLEYVQKDDESLDETIVKLVEFWEEWS